MEKAIQCTITKIHRDKDLPEGPRTNSISGYTPRKPTVGYRFVVYAEPIDKTKDFRWFETNVVQAIEDNNDHLLLTTASGSIYKVVLGGEIDVLAYRSKWN